MGRKKEKETKKMKFGVGIVNDPKEIVENLCKYFSEDRGELCHEAAKRSISPHTTNVAHTSR